ncbi:MAG: PHA/PHB synthase family protein [Gammaproteobacteria bacterium]
MAPEPFLDPLKENYLLYTRWLEDAIYKTPDVSEKTRRRAAFWTREFLSAVAPSNFFLTNPEAITRALQTGGQSVTQGWRNLLSDIAAGHVSMVDQDAFQVGGNIATTPGAVAYRNELVDLIQYTPTTEKAHSTPIVIVAPWINKYYILDINERLSLVRYLVAQGFTVFVTSWKNPGADMRDTTFDDYMLRGVLESLRAAREICDAPQVHLAGYCIGGTLVAALTAWLNREAGGKEGSPVAHITLLTTLADFSEPGNIEVFIDEQSLDAIDDIMAHHGYLDGRDMATSFRSLRSNSLIWHYWVQNYLLGESPPAFDVLYWNADSTRLPYAMHSFYLREFYLRNKLSEKDGVTLGGRPIDLSRITQPLYVISAEQDHIAPWKSVFKLCSLTRGPVRFVLATSGHIMGVLSPPVDPPKRRYWVGDATGLGDPDHWRASTSKVPNSWWTDWVAWLKPQCGTLRTPPALGGDPQSLLPAPGAYAVGDGNRLRSGAASRFGTLGCCTGARLFRGLRISLRAVAGRPGLRASRHQTGHPVRLRLQSGLCRLLPSLKHIVGVVCSFARVAACAIRVHLLDRREPGMPSLTLRVYPVLCCALDLLAPLADDLGRTVAGP